MASGHMRSYLWKVTLAVLLAGIGAAAVFLLSQSSVLAVNEIIVDGNRVIPTEQILEKAGPLLRNQSIIHPSFDAVRGELGGMPYIESVDFDRDFPNTVIIHIREYRALACLKGAAGMNYILAPDSRILAAQAESCPVMPVVMTKTPCAGEAGGFSECADVGAGTDFLANIPVSFNYEFAEVSVDNGDIRARTKTGVNVHFGSLDKYGLKFEVLRQLLARSVAAGVQVTIDVSVPERPVTKEEAPPPPPETITSADESAQAAVSAATTTGTGATVDGAQGAAGESGAGAGGTPVNGTGAGGTTGNEAGRNGAAGEGTGGAGGGIATDVPQQ